MIKINDLQDAFGDENCFLDEITAERTAKNPEFPKLVKKYNGTKPIPKNSIDQWEKQYFLTAKLEREIKDRIYYIISVWVQAFGGKLIDWHFSDTGRNDDFINKIDDRFIHSIGIITNPQPKNNNGHHMVIIDKNGDEYWWEYKIPIRWLFEDCAEEIIKGKALYEENLNKKPVKSAKEVLKEKNEALIAQAKSKLSKEELAALKKSLK